MQGRCFLPRRPADHILVKHWFWPKGCKKHPNSNSCMQTAGVAGSRHGSSSGAARSLASTALPGHQVLTDCQSSALPALFPTSFHHVLLHTASRSIWFGSGSSRIMTTPSVIPAATPNYPSLSKRCFPPWCHSLLCPLILQEIWCF